VDLFIIKNRAAALFTERKNTSYKFTIFPHMQPAKTIIELLRSTTLSGFPSGSSINYHNGLLYLVGDDANHLLILDKNYRTVQTLRLFNYATKRIPKNKKADLETASIIQDNDTTYLLILGSAATKTRKQALLMPIINDRPDIKQLSKPDFYNDAFQTELKMIGIKEINIEGSSVIGDHFVISNRGNLANPRNHIIFINKDFVLTQNQLSMFAMQLELPTVKNFAGVSELCYFPLKDILFLTLSSEATSSAYDDGVIGDSYIAWIKNFSQKIRQPVVEPDELFNLHTVHKTFVQQKIEGICVELIQDNELVMHLIADDDKGHSKMFKIRLAL
jgi:hypothetical protein